MTSILQDVGIQGPDDLTRGQDVRWWQPTGGWVHGKVVRVTPTRAVIEVEPIVPHGESRRFLRRVVRFKSLRRWEK